MKHAVKAVARKCILNAVKRVQYDHLTKEDQEFVDMHPEWEDLTEKEKSLFPKAEWDGYKIYKNLASDYNEETARYYVTDYRYQTELLPRLNKLNYARFGIRHPVTIFCDKNYQDVFSGLKFPEILLRNIQGMFYDSKFARLTKKEALALLNRYEKVVFKKSVNASHGKGIFVSGEYNHKSTMDQVKSNYVVQTMLRQHEFLAKFNASSVNITRITTLFWRGELYILGSIFRVGAPGAFCDHLGKDGVGPRFMRINEQGKLEGKAYDRDYGVFYDDCFGQKIEGEIPEFSKMKKHALEVHGKYPGYNIIGWDFTVDHAGNVICVEYNTSCPDAVRSQILCGPMFAKKSVCGSPLLDEIMETANDFIF